MQFRNPLYLNGMHDLYAVLWYMVSGPHAQFLARQGCLGTRLSGVRHVFHCMSCCVVQTATAVFEVCQQCQHRFCGVCQQQTLTRGYVYRTRSGLDIGKTTFIRQWIPIITGNSLQYGHGVGRGLFQRYCSVEDELRGKGEGWSVGWEWDRQTLSRVESGSIEK